jgi:hypothetical protein
LFIFITLVPELVYVWLAVVAFTVSSEPSPQFIIKSATPLLPFLVSKSIVSPIAALTSNINSSGITIPPDWPGKLDLSCQLEDA